MNAALVDVAPRIRRLIRLLGSDCDGEALAAVRALGRTLASIGEDFHTLANAVESAPERSAPAAHRECEGHREVARWILNSGAYLSFKERSFVTNVASRFGSLSPRQETWLADILERVSVQSRRA